MLEHAARSKCPWLQKISRGWKAYEKSFSSGREYAREALDLFGAAAETLRDNEDTESLPLALCGMGAAFHLLGTHDDLLRADKCYDEEMRLLERAGNTQELVQAVSSRQAVLRDLALLAPRSAFPHLEKGLKLGSWGMTLAARMGDARSLAWVSQTTADLCCILARMDDVYAAAHLETAVDLYQKAVALWDRVFSQGRPKKPASAAAPATSPESVRIADQASGAAQMALAPRDDAEGKILALMGMAEARILQGQDLDAARILLDEARDFCSQAGASSYQMGHVESLYGSLSLAEGDRDGACRHFATAAGIFDRLGFSVKRGEGAWNQGTSRNRHTG